MAEVMAITQADSRRQALLETLFSRYDTSLTGELTAERLRELHASLRGAEREELSIRQVEAAILHCCATDACDLSELLDCIRELDRRLQIVRHIRWEFQFLDPRRVGLITEQEALFLFRATHNERFSKKQFDRFLRTRPRPGTGVSFEELEVELCNVPDFISFKMEQQEREEKDEERRQVAMERAERLEEEARRQEMALKAAAAARAEAEKRAMEKRQDTLTVAVKNEEAERLRLLEIKGELYAKQKKRRDTQNEEMIIREKAILMRKERKEKMQEEEQQEEEKRKAEKARQEEEEKKRKEEEEEERKRKEEEAARLAKEKMENEERQRKQSEQAAQEAAEAEKRALAEAQEAAKALSQAKDEQSRQEALRRQEEAKARAKRQKEQRVKHNLTAAMKSRQAKVLEPAIKEVEKAELTDFSDELTEAKKLLRQLKAAIELEGAMSKRKLELLRKAMRAVRDSGAENELKQEMGEASRLLSRLEKLEQQKKEIQNLKNSTISELRSYSNPPAVVHHVMMATFLLLGVKEKDTRQWVNVQALMGRTGKESLKRKVLECEPDKIAPESIAKAKKHMEGFDAFSVRETSATAATFALWLETMIEEVEERTGSQVSLT